ncbi:proton-coupled folate transporter [Megalops cyprinoides]|uniref:proton-coupled folate transporter n=1 Tax=Megalops cyprinoides TaxID=118141 RepID=UPI0018645C91|nr:proton-coupled folate transporter [Megalops cyprinoides]
MSGWRERLRAVFTVEPVIFFYMTSTFIMTPASQQLIITKVCNELYASRNICNNPEHHKEDEDIQRQSSYVLLMYAGTLSLVSIPPAILLGSWSDRAGRKFGMVLPSLLSLVGGGVFIAMTLVESASAYWSVAAAAVTGVSGGYVSVFLSCFSYLADVTDSNSRTRRMAVAEAMIFIGGMVGFLLSGVLLQRFGFVVAFGAFCACHILALLYISLWLRDPGQVSSRLPATPSEVDAGLGNTQLKASILSYVRLSFRAVFRDRPGQERLKLHFLILCTFLNNLIAVGDQSILLLFLMYEPREFTTEMYGVFNSTRMLLLGFSLMGLFPLMLRCIGEMTLAKMSALLRAASYVLLAFSMNTWMVFLVAVVGAPSGITQAVIRSLSSAVVDPNEQGAMFSFMASMEALCILVAATIFNGMYPLTLATFPGMAFIVMAGFSFIVTVFMQSCHALVFQVVLSLELMRRRPEGTIHFAGPFKAGPDLPSTVYEYLHSDWAAIVKPLEGKELF